MEHTTWQEKFQEFLVSGAMFDVAIGTTIATAVNPLVRSLIDDIVMPPVGMVFGGVNFDKLYFVLKKGKKGGPYKSLQAAKKDNAVVVSYGNFINNLFNFIIVAGVAYSITIAAKNIRVNLRKEQVIREQSINGLSLGNWKVYYV